MAEYFSTPDMTLRTISAAGTVLLGLFAGLIAYRQARTASEKLRLDLFEKRHKVYVALLDWLNDLQGRVVPDKEYTVHMRDIQPVEFLFGKDVKDWVRSLRKQARDMNHARKVLEETRDGPIDEQRHQRVVEANETYSNVTMDIDDEIERSASIFAPYLDFGKTR